MTAGGAGAEGEDGPVPLVEGEVLLKLLLLLLLLGVLAECTRRTMLPCM